MPSALSLCALLASGLRGAPADGGELLVRPRACLQKGEAEDGPVQFIVIGVGHVAVQKPVLILDEASAEEWLARPRTFFCHHMPEVMSVADNIRCTFYTRQELEGTYLVRTEAERVPDWAVVVHSPKAVDPKGECLGGLEEEAAQGHAVIASHAREWGHGQHFYPGCNDLCSPLHCLGPHMVNTPYLLQPLWGSAPPSEVSVINIGCRDFGRDDPIFSLMEHSTLSGLCVDANGTDLAIANERLAGHEVKVVMGFVSPVNVQELLQHLWPSGVVDILKLDIDSFDVSVLNAALAVVQADVVMTEYNYALPPPFRYAQQFTDLEQGAGVGNPSAVLGRGLYGASVSYLVEFFHVRGYFLYKMSHSDIIWVHESVASKFMAADERLTFPVDEWACYLQVQFPAHHELLRWVPPGYSLEHTREWMFEQDVYKSLQRIWSNLTSWSQAPFTLDLAALHAPFPRQSGFEEEEEENGYLNCHPHSLFSSW